MPTQSIPDFVHKPEQYGMHNARPTPIEFMWGGNRFEIPGVDTVGPNPMKFPDGTPIPGTVVVKDGYVLDTNQMMPSGPPNWSAKEAIIAVLGVGPGGTATSKLAMNGVSYLPPGTTREQYQQIREAGESRYRDSLFEWASDTVQNYQEAMNKSKAAGVDSKPPGPEFYKAQAVLKAHEEEQKRLYGLPQEAAEADDELEFMVYAKARALALSSQAAEAQSVDKAKLAEQLLEDPRVVAQLRKKWSWRKKGYLDPESNPGAEQPEVEPQTESP